jgi:hypothetical protein
VANANNIDILKELFIIILLTGFVYMLKVVIYSIQNPAPPEADKLIPIVGRAGRMQLQWLLLVVPRLLINNQAEAN